MAHKTFNCASRYSLSFVQQRTPNLADTITAIIFFNSRACTTALRTTVNRYERSIKRNPLLAQLMYYTKDIESFGTGLKRITDACEKAGVQVEFQLLKKGFAVVFYRPGNEFDTTGKMSDVAINVVRNVVLNKPEQTVLSIIAGNPAITAEQVAALLSKSGRTVQRYLNGLQKKKVIRRIGAKKAGHWEIVHDSEFD